MEREILEIKALIGELRALDTDFRVLGSEHHHYEIGPTLSDTEIYEFEAQHNIRLPEDFRLYLRLVGNGSGRPKRPFPFSGAWTVAGAGPFLGLYPLSETTDDVVPRLPFVKKDLESLPEGWFSTPMIEDEAVAGFLNISSKGCATADYLVVNGDDYGTIWSVWSIDEIQPTGKTFSQWIREWAETHIPIARAERVTYSVKVGMTVAEVIAICNADGRHPESFSTGLIFEGLKTWFELDQEGKHITGIVKWRNFE